jgi:hypothetical protein
MNRLRHVGVIGGDEHDRDATGRSSSASGKLVSHPKLGSTQARSICKASIIHDDSAGGGQNVVNCVCHEIAVFDNQHALIFQGGTPPKC